MRKTLPLLMPATYCKLTRLFSFLLIGMLLTLQAAANNYPVISLANSGAGSLREAITLANGVAGPHNITFNVTGVINISTSLPTIIRQITIDGNNQVTISGPGGDNHIGLITLGTGSGGSIIMNMTLRNTGLEPIRLAVALSGITLYNLKLTQTSTHYANHGVLANAAVTNLTIRKVEITGLQDNYRGIYLSGTATGVMIDSFRILSGGGGTARAIQFVGAASNITIKNSFLDMDDPATTDDGDYCVIFNANANNILIDSTIFRDAEVYPLYCTGNSTINGLTLSNSTFDNQHGSTSVQAVRFETTTSLLNSIINKNTFNANEITSTNDGDYGVVLGSINNQHVDITNNLFYEYDGAGVHVGSNGHANNHDFLTIKGNTFHRNGQGADQTAGVRLYVRTATSDGGPVLITENIFNTNNGVAVGVYAGNAVASTVANFTVSKNTIYSTQSTLGAVYVRAVNKVVITENSIYNNVGLGIQLVTGGNCAYEGANVPQLLSSTETSTGIYSLSVKMPAICGTGNCALEIFSSAAGVTGVGGQHYVATRTGLASGTQNITNVAGAFPELNTAPYGTWTATLRVTNNNCGTSEFSNKIRVKVVGPAGVDLGIKLWLRGDEIQVNGSEPTADNQVITYWEELSGGGAPQGITVVNDPRTQRAGLNFNPVAQMRGDIIRGVFSGGTSWITSNALTTVGVFNPLSASVSADRFFVLFSQSGVDYNTNHAQIEWYRAADNILSYRGSTGLNPTIPGLTGVKAFNKPGLFSSVTAPTIHTGYYNGQLMGSGAYNKGNYAISQWFVGGGWGPNPNGSAGNTWYYMSESDFAEVFTYNRNLDAAELAKVESYMALKYGIAMKHNYVLSNGAIVWNVTTNAAYSKEIAALALDNVSILHQKQARAFQTDELVSFALGAEFALSNKENEAAITNNLSVLMWGNDSASTTFSQPFTAGAFANSRMHRVWKVQRTNWADQDITAKLTGGKEGLYLLVSNDPTFATITAELPLKADGTVTFNSSVLTNNAYFTFGRQQKKPGGVSSGLMVWVKADEGVALNGTDATSWEDQGPSLRVWAKNITTAIPYNGSGVNYNPALQFPGGTYYWVPAITSSFTQGEVFSVQSTSVNGVVSFPWELGGGSDGVGTVYRHTDNNMYLHFGVAARRSFSFGAKNMALPAILNVSSATNSWTASLDGRVMSGPTTVATAFPYAALTRSYIGAGHISTFQGTMPETILFNRKLNATERLQVNSYLGLKYGVTLDQTGATDYLASDGATTMWDASDNATFNKNIAGIGRDDDGTLYQKQSRSINTASSGNLISLAIGDAIAASNPANPDSIANDKSFLTWADNNGVITYATPVTGGKVTTRMARVWKADKTNWADRSVTIKLHGLVSNVYLLISNNDATFATININEELPMNADSTITINSDLLPDGAYFTFAKEIKGPGFVNNGVQFWLRADDGISVPANWNDFSGNDNDGVQVTAANQPLPVANSVNFNPGFDFDGANDHFNLATTAGISGTNLFTVVSVVKRGSVGNADMILGQQSDATNTFSNFFTATNKYATGPINVGNVSSTGTYGVANIPYLNATTRATGNLFSLYTNGAADGSGTQPTYNFLAATNLRIGWRGGATVDQFDGNINEVIVYNRTLLPAELQQVNSYLALKYGITLNNGATDYIATDGTTKMWTVSKNTGYTFNIAGIGRDDKTVLFQKQSRSVTDSQITVAVGAAIAADNLSNTSDIDDLSFFTWADNGLGTTFNVAVTSVANAASRMPRVWKVDRTNWNDQDITIKVVPGGERYVLVHFTDPTFGIGTTEYPINTSTGLVTINTADLPDGAYFTLGTKIVGPACVNNGIAAWFRADYAASTGAWVDFSGNQTNAAQAGAGVQPTLLANGLNYNPALTFDGNDYLTVPQASITGKVSTGNAARTLVGVGITTSTGDQLLMSYGGFPTNTASGLRVSSQRSVFEGSGALNGVVAPLNSFPVNKTNIISGRYEGGANGIARVYTNDTSVGTAGLMSWNTTLTIDGMQIGKYVGENRLWIGKIGEVIVYNRNLTDVEFHRVSSYLAIKYGINLDQSPATDYLASNGTTNMWTAADNIGYNRRITGIGRDDCTELNQKQSLSVDTGVVAIAMGDSVATSNFDNAGVIGNDDSYFVIADNGDTTQYNTPVAGLGAITTRMARTWKVDKTNWADADVTLKLTGANDKVYLIVSNTDATFDGSDAVYQLTAQGSATISTALIPDGAYFTFAKALNGPGFVNVGVQLWLRADDNVSTVDTWYDYSGNDNDAKQPTVANQPTAVINAINYHPSFDFDGAADYMDFATNAGISGTNPFTVVHATIRGSIGTSDAMIAQQGTVANTWMMNFTSTNKHAISAAGGAAVNSITNIAANIPYLMAGTRTGTDVRLYNSGAADGNATQAYTFLSSNLRLGNRATSADGAFDGNIHEVAVYNRVLTADELRQVQSYLALKYGITLSGNYLATDGATTYWDATTNTGYLNNVAGIGRDDQTGLNQKQSRSVNTVAVGNMIAMGLTTIEASNKDNTAAFTDNLSFLVWGDNAATGIKDTEYPLVLNPTNCSKVKRLQREWKVQKTGAVNDVQLLFYLAGQVPSSTVAGDLRLLVDTDGDFGNGGTTIIDASAYDGATQVATFDGLNFNSGEFFTLVTDLTNQAPGGIVSGLNAWFRADKGVTTATGVSLWADQSLSLANVTQATGGAQPPYNATSNLINFNPDLSFTGTSSQFMSGVIGHTATLGEEIFAVVALPTAATGSQTAVGLGTSTSSSNTTELRVNTGSISYVVNAGATTHTVASNGQVLLTNANRSAAGAAAIVLNGTQVVTNTMTPVVALNQVNIGARRLTAANTLFFTGQVAEVAVYNKQLTPDERTKVETYLAIKYGITLSHDYVDPGNTTIWSTGANVGYGNNITGIGREDCNGMHQKQSKSVNAAEALVTIGHGLGISATNASNSNIMNNATALLVGDNNGNRTAFTTAGAPANRERIARTWKVQETGVVGSATVQVPANSSTAGVELPLERDGVVYLLVSSTNNFTSGATEVPMTLNGDNWEVNYDFANADFFTFATNDACVSTQALLTTYNAETIAAPDKCYVNGWLLFRDPVDATKFIAGIYDPTALIDPTKITARVVVNANLNDIGKAAGTQATRLMRRLLQVDCASCYDAGANPAPGFVVRMFYSPDEKAGSEDGETNSMVTLKSGASITDPHFFKWFKAAGKTAAQVVSELTPGGIAAGGQEWIDGQLPTGQLDGIEYIDFTGVNSFSTFGGTWLVNLTLALPVTWLDVQAVPLNNQSIQVKWSTATELNNAGFVVERSENQWTWQSIATVAGNGTTSHVSRYSVIDNNVKPGVKYYYRIKQTDLNGRVSYSKIVIALADLDGLVVLVKGNPVKQVLQLEISSGKQQALQVVLSDVSGKVLHKQTVTVPAGTRLVPTDVSAYPNGTYFIRVITATGVSITNKFAVQKGL